MFEPFPKLTRFSHDWVVTEKIDGTNAQIIVVRKDNPLFEDAMRFGDTRAAVLAEHAETDQVVLAGSRTRLIGREKGKDNHGFAQFVYERAAEIITLLGEGRHFGEWYGNGIQRNYGLKEKRFALFNTARWHGAPLPDRFDVVPVLFKGYLHDASVFDEALHNLKAWGSMIAPGYLDPEGIVMRHGPSGTIFKKTFDYDEAGKWAENQARKA